MNDGQHSILIWLFALIQLCLVNPYELTKLSRLSLSNVNRKGNCGLILAILPANPCMHDRITIHINSSTNEGVSSAIRLAITLKNNPEYLFILDPWISHDDSFFPEIEGWNSVITCDIDELHCQVEIFDIIADFDSKSLTLRFNEATNQQPLMSTAAIINAFDMNPAPIGSCIGDWLDSKTLRIALEDKYLDALVKAHQRGQVKIALRKTRRINGKILQTQQFFREYFNKHEGNDTSVQFNIRWRETGEFQVFAIDGADSILSEGASVTVRRCNDINISPTFQAFDDNHDNELLPRPKAVITFRGVLALSGSEGININRDTFPALVRNDSHDNLQFDLYDDGLEYWHLVTKYVVVLTARR